MKKTLLLVLPLLFIMSCDTDDDETSDGLVGTWTVESVTYYEKYVVSNPGLSGLDAGALIDEDEFLRMVGGS